MDSKKKAIRKFIKALTRSSVRRLDHAMRTEAWGQVLEGHDHPDHIQKVRSDLEKLQLVPHELIASDHSVARFVATATERLLDPSERH